MLESFKDLIHHPYTAAVLGLVIGFYILHDVVRAIVSMILSFYRRRRQS